MLLRVVDVETTGKTSDDAVVELAALDLVDGCLGECRSSLINPLRSIPPEASAVHGITDPDIADAPLLDEVAPFVLTDLPPSFYVAHYVDFEKMFLGDRLNAPLICTLKCAMRVWPEAQAFNLSYLRYWLCLGDLGARANPPHRAPADVFVTAHVLGRLLGEAAVEDMVAWTREPMLYPRIPFGKHEGQPWSSAPDSYLDWILNKPNDLSEDMKWNARKEVVRRSNEKRDAYVASVLKQIPELHSLEVLNIWWDSEKFTRADLGIEKGERSYDDIVKACSDRKASLVSQSRNTEAL